MEKLFLDHGLAYAGAPEIWINQSGFCRQQNSTACVKYELIEVGPQKPYQTVKSEKYENLFVSNLFWRQK